MTPTTLDEAVDALLAGMDSLDRAEFLATTDSAYHFSGGMAMRNTWRLWDKTAPLSRFFAAHGIRHADDSSATIYRALRARLTKQPFDLAAEADYYARFWTESEQRHAEGGTHHFRVDRETGHVEFTD